MRKIDGTNICLQGYGMLTSHYAIKAVWCRSSDVPYSVCGVIGLIPGFGVS